MELIAEEHLSRTQKQQIDLTILLHRSINSDTPFLLLRYPTQSPTLASYDPSSNGKFTFAAFGNGQSTVIDHISLLDISEIEAFEAFQPQKKERKYPPAEVSKGTFLGNVQLATAGIKKGHFTKVVLSKTKKVDQRIDTIATFYNLEKKYPTALVYCFYHPQCGLWVGATPEKVLEKDGTGQYHIHSLAGTKKLDEDWTSKEKDEQQIVTDYVISQLKTQGVTDIKSEGPMDYNYGEIKHLKSSIHFKSDAPQSELVRVIHPTPAVCGMPLSKAREFIINQEGYDRSYYTGYMGIQNLNQINDTYFVNLRCMQVIDDNTYIYAGAGIVADSNPQSEWAEIEAKASTLIECIKTNG